MNNYNKKLMLELKKALKELNFKELKFVYEIDGDYYDNGSFHQVESLNSSFNSYTKETTIKTKKSFIKRVSKLMKNDNNSFEYLIEKINKYVKTGNKDILLLNDTILVKNQNKLYHLQIIE